LLVVEPIHRGFVDGGDGRASRDAQGVVVGIESEHGPGGANGAPAARFEYGVGHDQSADLAVGYGPSAIVLQQGARQSGYPAG
jgi:hypothetical protein